MENRTARLTLLIDPKKKAVFEQLCKEDDVTPSQMVRQFIRDYIEARLGRDWREQVFANEDESPFPGAREP
ncbi:MAG TPA: CopG family transcriptional regulator [Gammaproteobacteria bacterium]|nr:CopG family transcriptional regulator [Gammaproteobacteria bacterium]